MLPAGWSLGFPYCYGWRDVSTFRHVGSKKSFSGLLDYELKDEGKNHRSICISNLALFLEVFNVCIQS